MMTYRVIVTQSAEDDVYAIHRYIKKNDSVNKAEYVVSGIKQVLDTLIEFPDRGHIAPELERLSSSAYREVHYKPYRIIYDIIDKTVYIHAVLDGRRELQPLLEERLLR